MRNPGPLLLLLLLVAGPLSALEGAEVLALAMASDYDGLRAQGPAVMEVLAELYAGGSQEERRQVAYAFYQLGWESEAAKAALLPDLHSDDEGFRITVQYALGRVSADDEVVDLLLEAMRQGESLRIRDKAACALAYDQIHLAERQKVQLFAGLIRSLDDDKEDVRRIAAKALRIHTGQTRGYRARAPREERLERIEEWRRWLAEYRREVLPIGEGDD